MSKNEEKLIVVTREDEAILVRDSHDRSVVVSLQDEGGDYPSIHVSLTAPLVTAFAAAPDGTLIELEGNEKMEIWM